jgi:glutathione S-transferase
MTIKLHRCPVMFAKTSGHPCWKVQKALDEAGIDYEVVKQPIRKSKRTDLAARSGQRLLPAIEFEDGTILREESTDLVTRIRDGRLHPAADSEKHAHT